MTSSPEAKQLSDVENAQAFSEFRKRFPRADISRFTAQVDFDPNRKAGECCFKMVMDPGKTT